jgi:hypothetical protein
MRLKSVRMISLLMSLNARGSMDVGTPRGVCCPVLQVHTGILGTIMQS